MYDTPDSTAARKRSYYPPVQVSLLGVYHDFQLVSDGELTGWLPNR